MTTNFRINGTDTDDLFVRKDIFTEGGLWLWGSNSDGQLGDNTGAGKSSPVQTVSGGTNWKQIACAPLHTTAIKTDGTLWLWGYNAFGGLGDNTTTTKVSPVQTIAGGTNWKQVDGNYYHTAAIKTDGTLWLWGYNGNGELGDNTRINKSSPVQTVSAGTTWKKVSCGTDHTAAIKTDGTLWLWGYNAQGQLGDQSIINKSSPVQTISGGTNWKQVSCGSYHTAAIKTDGTLWLWGQGISGALGDNTTTNKSSPIQTVSGGTNWKQVACGDTYTAAVKTDGTLWLWGVNNGGKLGDNTLTDRSSPVQTIAGGTNWKQVACGQYHTSAIKTDGTLWIWGFNSSGQLGDNTVADKSSPIQTIASGSNWKQIDCGYTHTAAIREDYWA